MPYRHIRRLLSPSTMTRRRMSLHISMSVYTLSSHLFRFLNKWENVSGCYTFHPPSASLLNRRLYVGMIGRIHLYFRKGSIEFSSDKVVRGSEHPAHLVRSSKDLQKPNHVSAGLICLIQPDSLPFDISRIIWLLRFSKEIRNGIGDSQN